MQKVVILTVALLFAFATTHVTATPLLSDILNTDQVVVTFGGLKPNTLPTMSSTEYCLPTSQALNAAGNIIQLSLTECDYAEFSISFDWDSSFANHTTTSLSASHVIGTTTFSVDSEDCNIITAQVDGEWHLTIASCQHDGPHQLRASHPSSKKRAVPTFTGCTPISSAHIRGGQRITFTTTNDVTTAVFFASTDGTCSFTGAARTGRGTVSATLVSCTGADGTRQVRATLTDLPSGQTGTLTIPYFYDTTPPVFTPSLPVNSSVRATTVLSFTSNEAIQAAFTLSSPTCTFSPPTLTVNQTVITATVLKCSTIGPFNLSITATDTAGNIGTYSFPYINSELTVAGPTNLTVSPGTLIFAYLLSVPTTLSVDQFIILPSTTSGTTLTTLMALPGSGTVIFTSTQAGLFEFQIPFAVDPQTFSFTIDMSTPPPVVQLQLNGSLELTEGIHVNLTDGVQMNVNGSLDLGTNTQLNISSGSSVVVDIMTVGPGCGITLDPQSSVEIHGKFHITPNGTLRTHHNHTFDVSGQAALSGTLVVTYPSLNEATQDQTVPVMKYGSRDGSFTTVTIVDPETGQSCVGEPAYAATIMSVSLAPCFASNIQPPPPAVPVGAIVGGVVGSVVLLALVALLLIFLVKPIHNRVFPSKNRPVDMG